MRPHLTSCLPKRSVGSVVSVSNNPSKYLLQSSTCKSSFEKTSDLVWIAATKLGRLQKPLVTSCFSLCLSVCRVEAASEWQTEQSPGTNCPKMWMSRLKCIAMPALQRGTSALAGQVLRTAPRPGQTGKLPSVQLCGQHTLGSASVPFTRQSVRHAQALKEERMVEVEWEGGGHSLYPFIWLRDNCQCPMCTLESAQARKLLMSDIDVSTGVDSVDVTDDSKVNGCLFFFQAQISNKCFLRGDQSCLNLLHWMCKCLII